MRSLMLSIGLSAVLLGSGCAVPDDNREPGTVGTSGYSESRNVASEDDTIESELQANLSALPALEAEVKSGQITFDADGGTVELDGTVDSESDRAEAVNMAWAIAGVTGVEDDLKIRQ